MANYILPVIRKWVQMPVRGAKLHLPPKPRLGNHFRMNDAALTTGIDSRRADLIGLTQDPIRVPTLNPPGLNCRAVREYPATRLSTSGLALRQAHARGAPGDSDKHPAEITAPMKRVKSRRPGFHCDIRDLFEVHPVNDGPRRPHGPHGRPTVIKKSPRPSGLKCRLTRRPCKKSLDRSDRLQNRIVCGPGLLHPARQPDKWVSVRDMLDCAKVMALSLKEPPLPQPNLRRALWHPCSFSFSVLKYPRGWGPGRGQTAPSPAVGLFAVSNKSP